MGLTGPEKDRSFKYNEGRFEGCSFIREINTYIYIGDTLLNIRLIYSL